MYIQKPKPYYKIPIIASVILHIIVFYTFMYVRLDTNANIIKAFIPVTFLKEQKAKVLRRSIPARAIASLDKPHQRYSFEPLAYIHPNYISSSSVYLNNELSKVFSEIESLRHESSQWNGIQQIPMDFRQRPIAITLDKPIAKPAQAKPVAFKEHKLIDDASLIQAKPEIFAVIDINNNLQKFFDFVKKRIESKKKYPMSAINAGIEGRSGVKMILLKNGQLEKVEIIDSSGNDTLDNAALKSIRDAVPFPMIPEGIGQDKIEMSIYIVFKIT